MRKIKYDTLFPHCAKAFTYIGSGTTRHDSFECIKVELWSAVVLKLGYGLAKPVQGYTDLL